MSDEKGVCFFAYNNDQIDYVELALLAAGYVKKYLGLPVCLITDNGSYSWLRESKDKEDIKRCIDYIVETDDELPQNMRRHYDSPYAEFTAQFSNGNKHKVYEYSPFEQTLLLDIDYIVKTDFLNQVFDSNVGVAMFDRAVTSRNEMPSMGERRLNDCGVKMWWSTVVYFDRSEKSKLFFDTWSHVAENYDFYQYLYNFPGKLFRTDYCVSVAAHILNGMEEGDVIGNFNDTPMSFLSQKDDIIEVNSVEDWILLSHDPIENWKNILVKHSKLDLHAMNKRALARVLPKLMEYLRNG